MEPDIQAMLDARRYTQAPEHPLNMYAIFRADLEMDCGKLAAQSGHAFSMCYNRAMIERPDITSQYIGSGNGTKICMYAKNVGQIIRAYRDCRAAGIPCEIIIDRGHVLLPHFDGNPIITAIGIGPASRDEAQHITKRYTMIKS